MTDHPTDGELAREGKITQAEMIELFGEEMPVEAVNLVWDVPGDWTIGQVRAELRRIAALRTPEQPANTDHTDAALADEVAGIVTAATLHGSTEVVFSLEKVRQIACALRTPATVNAEQPGEGLTNCCGVVAIPYGSNMMQCPKCGAAWGFLNAEQPAEPQQSVMERFIAALPSWMPAGHVDEARKALIAALASSRSSETELLREAVLAVRRANAGSFDRQGAVWEAYDRAVLDCIKAIDATLTNGDG